MSHTSKKLRRERDEEVNEEAPQSESVVAKPVGVSSSADAGVPTPVVWPDTEEETS